MKRGNRLPGEQRRYKIARYLLENPLANQQDLVREFGISRSTACRDVKLIREEWSRKRVEAYESFFSEGLQRYEYLYQVLAPQVRAGDQGAIELSRRILDSEARLLGLDKKRNPDLGDTLIAYFQQVLGQRWQQDDDRHGPPGNRPVP